MIWSAIVAAMGIIGSAGFTAYWASRGEAKVAPADAAQKIADAATDLLEPYRQQVADLTSRQEKLELTLADVRVELSIARRRVDLLVAQVSALGHEPAQLP